MFFGAAKSYGFIQSDEDGAEHFVHLETVNAAGLPTLRAGQRISYRLLTARNGKVSAVDPTLLE